jgi:hypothetical protein
MSMVSFPFASTSAENPDRAMGASDWRNFFATLYNTGVFLEPSTSLQVGVSQQASEVEMYVTVSPGTCLIEGAIGVESTTREMMVQSANASYDRIDRVVARLNLNSSVRSIDLYVLQGTAATVPTAPELTRTANIFEICLGELFIARGSTTISAARITDTRLNNDVCGMVTAIPTTIDTTTIFTSYEAYLAEIESILSAAIDETLAGQIMTMINEINTPTQEMLDNLADTMLKADLTSCTGYVAYVLDSDSDLVVLMHITTSAAISSATTIATLPSGYRPATAQTITITDGTIVIGTDGTVVLTPTSSIASDTEISTYIDMGGGTDSW